MRSAKNGRGRGRRPLPPFIGRAPTAGGDQIADGCRYGCGPAIGRDRPLKRLGTSALQGYKKNPETDLRHTELDSIECRPIGVESEIIQSATNTASVRFKSRCEHSPYILDQNCPWLGGLNNSQHVRKQIAIIVSPKLFPGD